MNSKTFFPLMEGKRWKQKWETYRKTERKNDGKADRQKDRKTDRQKDRKKERQKDRKTERQIGRKTERLKDRKRWKQVRFFFKIFSNFFFLSCD